MLACAGRSQHTMIGSLAAAEIGVLCRNNNLPVIHASSPYCSQVRPSRAPRTQPFCGDPKSMLTPLSPLHARRSQVTWVVLQFDTAKLAAMKVTPEHLRQTVGDLVFGHKAGYTIHRLILVGTDIDVFDDKDVMWAFTTRCRPGKDETFFEECKGFPLIPYMRCAGRLRALVVVSP